MIQNRKNLKKNKHIVHSHRELKFLLSREDFVLWRSKFTLFTLIDPFEVPPKEQKERKRKKVLVTTSFFFPEYTNTRKTSRGVTICFWHMYAFHVPPKQSKFNQTRGL